MHDDWGMVHVDLRPADSTVPYTAPAFTPTVDTSVQAPESIAKAWGTKRGGLMEVGAELGCQGARPW